MKTYFLLTLIFTLLLGFNQSFAQSTPDSVRNDTMPDFSNMTMLGNEGIVGYKLSYETESDVNLFKEKLVEDFGKVDETTKGNNHLWRNLIVEEWHDKPVTLNISFGRMLNSDGSPMGKTWITISVETPDEKMLLEPETESYRVIKAYFDNIKDQSL